MKRALWLPFLFVPALAFAQVSEKITVSLVEVPVTVFDGSGNPVRGLKAENFELSDDRGTHAITSFDVMDYATAGADVAAPARRNFLLLFDLSNATPNKLERAKNAARDFVKRQAHPTDLLAVGTIDAEYGFRMVTAFTTDRALAVAAIDNPKAYLAKDPLGIANQTGVGDFNQGVAAGQTGTCFT